MGSLCFGSAVGQAAPQPFNHLFTNRGTITTTACCLHGIFVNDNFRHAWLESLGWHGGGMSQSEIFNQSLEALADAVEESLNMELLEMIIWDN